MKTNVDLSRAVRLAVRLSKSIERVIWIWDRGNHYCVNTHAARRPHQLGRCPLVCRVAGDEIIRLRLVSRG